jgi:hypothetical protein
VRILKRALNRCLWFAFAGTLKVALVIYILSLPSTAVANAASEKAVKAGETPSDKPAEGNVSSPSLRLAAMPLIARLRREFKAEPIQSN